MKKEIHEQAETVHATMRGRVHSGPLTPGADPYTYSRIMLGGLTSYKDTIRTCSRMIFIACGTSYHAALACRNTLEELLPMPVHLELASDLQDRPNCKLSRSDVCVFVSQSGETADTLRALEFAMVSDVGYGSAQRWLQFLRK